MLARMDIAGQEKPALVAEWIVLMRVAPETARVAPETARLAPETARLAPETARLAP
jgi:hypothetical protein